jgi:hypothetical protein
MSDAIVNVVAWIPPHGMTGFGSGDAVCDEPVFSEVDVDATLP